MKTLNKITGLALVALAVALTGWASTASASDFTKALTKDYFALARVQYYYSSDPFAVKARAADQGKVVLPDDPAKKKLSSKDRADLTAAHGRLMKALNGGFREQNPKQASKAQTSFDCWLDAVLIGMAQAVAILPGISRSGSTITAGLWRGLERDAAARFAFLMSLPAILGAAVLNSFEIGGLAREVPIPLAVGGLAAAITGFIAIDVTMRAVRVGRLGPFALYCAIVGALALVVGGL